MSCALNTFSVAPSALSCSCELRVAGLKICNDFHRVGHRLVALDHFNHHSHLRPLPLEYLHVSFLRTQRRRLRQTAPICRQLWRYSAAQAIIP